jgi:hypothetical protein
MLKVFPTKNIYLNYNYMYQIGNFSFSVLDMNAERGARISTDAVQSPGQTFLEEAKDDIKRLFKQIPAAERPLFVNAYFEGGMALIADSPRSALRIAAVAGSYMYAPSKKYIVSCVSIAPFYKEDTHYHPLWVTKHFRAGVTPIYLNKQVMLEKLRPILGQGVNAEEGILEVDHIKYVAWHISSPKGEFFIPWHSGAILNKEEGYTFAACPFKEMPKLYNCLKFKELGHDVYSVKTC